MCVCIYTDQKKQIRAGFAASNLRCTVVMLAGEGEEGRRASETVDVADECSWGAH